MLGSIVNGIGNAIGNTVEDLAGEVLDLDLDLDFQTLCGLGMGIATGNPMLISRGVLDVVDGEDDNLVQTFDQYSGPNTKSSARTIITTAPPITKATFCTNRTGQIRVSVKW